MQTAKLWPDHIESKLEGLTSPARAYALAKAAFEIAEEKNFAEQREAIRLATLDDPEPDLDKLVAAAPDRDALTKALDLHGEWDNRTKGRKDVATAPIIARYPTKLKELYKLAEQNLVDWAEEQLKKKYGAAFVGVEPAFKAYRDNGLFGGMREKFLKICFNCPEL